ncbi:MAG TPA: hypothetical protein VF895_07090 [Gaiellaceae bacterium]
MLFRRGILIALCAAGELAAAFAARGSDSAPLRLLPAGPDSGTQPPLDGCARDRGAIFTREVPNWVYVGGSSSAQLQSVSGLVDSKYEGDLAAHPTGIDDPFTHTSYDFVFNVKPDAQFSSLLGSANFEGQGQESERLHVERETGSFPMFAWPDRGDRVSLIGSWVWDCDHFAPAGEHTEIHPFRVLWVERGSRTNAAGDKEADLFVTNAATPADTSAVCATQANGDRAAFKQCARTPAGPVEPGGPGCFVLRATTRPSGSAHLAYRVVDRGSVGHVAVVRRSRGVSVCYGETPGAVAKQVFVGWRPGRARPMHLRISGLELLVRRAMDPGCPPFAPDCPAKVESTLLGQVTTAPGEWNVYLNAGGVWAPWKPGLIRPSDGQTIRSKQRIDFYVPRGKPWRLFVQTRECDFGSVGNAYSPTVPVTPCPRANEIGNAVGDDEPGILVAHFRSPQASLGLHHTNSQLAGSTCPASNTRGCYRLTYRVAVVSDQPRKGG